MLRSKEANKKYREDVQKIEGCPLCWRRKHGDHNKDIYYENDIALIECDYPYVTFGTNTVRQHLMLISKDCDPVWRVKTKMLEIAIQLKPDSILINYNHRSSCPDHYHVHLIYTYEQTSNT